MVFVCKLSVLASASALVLILVFAPSSEQMVKQGFTLGSERNNLFHLTISIG